ncbi:cholinephosphotransferase 1-like [Xenia sp. Carnegie-2017]|uniref:cholinephosphotransferase 1-like n=1 Tax=Xenia sp. Carnegie-2017 TaxID=2897299 RepID=UPI001F0420DF|nr:cholinephosphotransferase 1-like [Xenia sp. Carnegie-2017]
MSAVLNENQLKKLSKHKYNAECSTLFDPIMQIWWRWFVERMPLWVAPNTITILGLLINFITTLILVYFSPQAHSKVPSWSLYLNGFGLFVYQTLDAIDGKQARRTNSSSPLGELFDHGCDAMSMVIVMSGVSVALKLGEVPHIMVFLTFAACVLFYFTHWRAYVTGVVRFGIIDITEMQLFGVLLFSACGFYGQEVILLKVPVLQFDCRELIFWLGIVSFLCVTLLSIYEILQGGVGKNGSSIADTSVLSPAVPLVVNIYLIFYNYTYSNSHVFERSPLLFVFAFGIVLAKTSILLVVACMCKSPIPMLDYVLMVPFLQLINIHFNSPMSEYKLLWFCLIFSFLHLIQYCYVVINEICDYLNVRCFTITPKQVSQQSTKKGS